MGLPFTEMGNLWEEQVCMLQNCDYSLGLVTLDYFRQLNTESRSHLNTQVRCLRQWSDLNIYLWIHQHMGRIQSHVSSCGHPESEQPQEQSSAWRTDVVVRRQSFFFSCVSNAKTLKKHSWRNDHSLRNCIHQEHASLCKWQ